MSPKPLLPLAAFWIATLLALPAQTPNQNNPPAGPADEPASEKTDDQPTKNRFWQASVGGGQYMVALDRISSISRHQYLLDGSFVVDEVTVDSLGQALARFYFITPVTDAARGNPTANAAARIVDRGRELIDRNEARAGLDLQNMVVKKYPDTTHARTIEYRVLSASELSGLYKSVRTAWESGRGRSFTIK